jgi:hypothetical protein
MANYGERTDARVVYTQLLLAWPLQRQDHRARRRIIMLKRYGWTLLLLAISVALNGCGYVAAGVAGAATERAVQQHNQKDNSD